MSKQIDAVADPRFTEWLFGEAQTFDINRILETLREGFPVRNAGVEIEKLLKEKNIKPATLNGLLEVSNFGAYLAKWKKGSQPSRDMAIKLAFALGMDGRKACDFLVGTCWHEEFYMRNYKDIIYRFCLDRGLSYTYACKLIKKYQDLDGYNPDARDLSSTQNLTKFFTHEYNALTSEKDLEDFLCSNKGNFGSFNRTAYRIFIELYLELKSYMGYQINEAKREVSVYLPELFAKKNFYDIKTSEELMRFLEENADCIDNPDTAYHIIMGNLFIKQENNEIQYIGNEVIDYESTEEAIPITVEEICKVVSMGIPGSAKRKTSNLIQRLLAQDMPNPQALDEILKKKVDKNGNLREVPRRYLILFNILSRETDGFEEAVYELNGILEECGMPWLDTRNVFDWIVMHSLYAATESDAIDADVIGAKERMLELAEKIFSNGELDTNG